MKNKPTHTPTPWRWKVDKNFPQAVRVYSDNIEISSVSKHAKDLEEAQANAAFIVNAVNAHDELVACTELLLQLDTECHARPDKMNGLLLEARARVVKALAQARGVRS